MSAARVKTKYPGIYKRGGRYVWIAYANGRQRNGSAATLAEAKSKRAELLADVRRDEYREVSRVTFVDYAREWDRHVHRQDAPGHRR
jgi:hypothetical protein